MCDFQKFNETLPSKNEFYSSFSANGIGDKEYKNVFQVLNKFEMKRMKNYPNLYSKCDVLLLADVLEKFRNRSLKDYGLSPTHYLSALAVSWDAMPSMTKVKLDLISDIAMYLFFEIGIRGGVSYISKRYSKANNKSLTSNDLKKPEEIILHTWTKIIHIVMLCIGFYQI